MKHWIVGVDWNLLIFSESKVDIENKKPEEVNASMIIFVGMTNMIWYMYIEDAV